MSGFGWRTFKLARGEREKRESGWEARRFRNVNSALEPTVSGRLTNGPTRSKCTSGAARQHAVDFDLRFNTFSAWVNSAALGATTYTMYTHTHTHTAATVYSFIR